MLPETKSDREKKAAEDKKSEANKTAVEKQIKDLADQLEAMNKTEKDKQTASEVATVEKERKAEEDRIAAQADLQELLKGTVDKEKDNSGDGINDLTNAELLTVIGEAVETSVSARIEQAMSKVDTSIGDTNAGIKMLSTVVGKMVAGQGLTQVRSDHPDFDTYKTEIGTILQQHASLSYDEAYCMAKGQKIGDTPGAQNLQMERGDDIFANLSNQNQTVNRNLADEVALKGSRDRSVNQETEVRVDNTHGVQVWRKACAAAAAKVVGARPPM